MTQISTEKMIEFITPFILNPGEKEITARTNLITELGLDILDVVELIMEIENKFEINIRDEDIFKTAEELRFTPTPEELTKFINGWLSEK